MTSKTLACLIAALSISACDKGGSDTSSSGATAKPAPAAEPGAAPAAPATPATAAVKSEYKADELWTAANAMSRLERMEKFVDGVTVTGTIKGIKDDPAGVYTAEIDAGGSHIIELGFADFGKVAKQKPLKVGDAVTATKCQVTNPQGDRMALVMCDLK